MNYYDLKASTYYSGTREDIISMLPKSTSQKVMEVGAGGGDSLCFIKENKLAGEVVGVELFDLPDSNQNNPLIDQFVHSNLEDEKLPLQENYFDVIIIADVLEHLVDPWKTFTYLSKFLKSGGIFLVSLPNIREYKTLVKVFFFGDFRYREDGILDKTHLRFFCKKNMKEMLKISNTSIQTSSPAFKIRSDRKGRKLLNLLTLGVFEQLFAIQYLFEVKKTDA